MQITKADLLTYRALQKALNMGRVNLLINYHHLNRQGCPIYDIWENLLPILFPCVFSLAVMITVGLLTGIIVLLFSVILYVYFIKAYLEQKLKEKAFKYITASVENLVELWKFGGIELVFSLSKAMKCKAPKGDWRKFTNVNLADFIGNEESLIGKLENTQKEKNEETEKKPKSSARQLRKNQDKLLSNNQEDEAIDEDIFNLDGILEDDK